jgi:hypothetical protein
MHAQACKKNSDNYLQKSNCNTNNIIYDFSINHHISNNKPLTSKLKVGPMIRNIYAFSLTFFRSLQLQIACTITDYKPRKEEAYYTMQPLKKRDPTNESDKAFSFTTVRKYKVIN